MGRRRPTAADTPSERVVSAGFHERVFQVVRNIPHGSVATYGQVAEILGHPGVARHVGNALAMADKSAQPVPWHRVVNARGMISTRGGRQRALLQREGVRFTPSGAVDLAKHRWAGP